MKKLLLFFITVTLISCGGKDDDDLSGRTTDPLIGTWTCEPYSFDEFVDVTDTVVFNSDGTFTGNSTTGEVYSGGWSNSGNDFDSARQIYTFTYPYSEESETVTIIFSSDFNSFDDSDLVWTRQ